MNLGVLRDTRASEAAQERQCHTPMLPLKGKGNEKMKLNRTWRVAQTQGRSAVPSDPWDAPNWYVLISDLSILCKFWVCHCRTIPGWPNWKALAWELWTRQLHNSCKDKGRITDIHPAWSASIAKLIKKSSNEMNAFHLSYSGCRLDCKFLGLEPLGKISTPRVSSNVVFYMSASSVTLLPSNCAKVQVVRAGRRQIRQVARWERQSHTVSQEGITPSSEQLRQPALWFLIPLMWSGCTLVFCWWARTGRVATKHAQGVRSASHPDFAKIVGGIFPNFRHCHTAFVTVTGGRLFVHPWLVS